MLIQKVDEEDGVSLSNVAESNVGAKPVVEEVYEEPSSEEPYEGGDEEVQ
jgi:hypothetical protein